MDIQDAGYVCTLDEASLRVAEEELHEKPADRLSSVNTLRQWILQQTHLRCWTDTATLLMYLRGAKFSQIRARELIQNTLEIFTKLPDWMANLDPMDPGVLEYIKSGYYLMLPKRDKLNRQIFMIRQGVVPTKSPHFSLKNQMRSSMVIDRMLRSSEETQVHGFVLVFDMTGYTIKHMKEWTPENSKKQMRVYQDALPGRVKGLHFYNSGSLFETMFAMAKPFMKKKNIDRMGVHATLESLYKIVPMELLPAEYLPDDYTGPNAGPVQSLIDDMYAKVTSAEYRRALSAWSSSKYGMDLGKLPDTVHQGSYRKLQVD